MYCILIAGIPASGKTKMAGELMQRLRLPAICKDKIKELLFDTVGFNSRMEKVKLGVGSMEIMYYFAETMMSLGLPFILENNFENISKPGLQHILTKYSYTPITVRLVGDTRAIQLRGFRRSRLPERHPGHLVNDHYPLITPVVLPDSVGSVESFAEPLKSRGMLDFSVGGVEIEVDVTDIAKINYTDIAERIKRVADEIIRKRSAND